MTSGEMACLGRLQSWLFDAAALERVWAARVETAALRRVDRARHVALEDDAPAVGARLRNWHCGEQRLRIGVLRRREDAPLRRDLDDLAEIHHGDAVRHV